LPGLVGGSILNQGTCWGGTTTAQRYVYSVTVAGRTGVAAIGNAGDAYFDCGYNPGLTGTVQPLFTTFNQTVPCYVDQLFLTPFAAITPGNGNNVLTKDFAYLFFSSTNITTWGAGEGYRTAGLYLGYIWIAIAVMVSFSCFFAFD
jgi:hypothetical protein